MRTITFVAMMLAACDKEQTSIPPTAPDDTPIASAAPSASTAPAASDAGSKNCFGAICAGDETCCGLPVNGCVKGGCKTRSRRAWKKDIAYLDPVQQRAMHDAIVSYKLASWRYKEDSASSPLRYGFVIDDVGQSPAVASDGEHVDLYGYTTMAIAALQVQARQIEDLEGQVRALSARCSK
jgi:hypothetical protein